MKLERRRGLTLPVPASFSCTLPWSVNLPLKDRRGGKGRGEEWKTSFK